MCGEKEKERARERATERNRRETEAMRRGNRELSNSFAWQLSGGLEYLLLQSMIPTDTAAAATSGAQSPWCINPDHPAVVGMYGDMGNAVDLLGPRGANADALIRC